MIDDLIKVIEGYEFECDGGNLKNCEDWKRLKVEIACLIEDYKVVAGHLNCAQRELDVAGM